MAEMQRRKRGSRARAKIAAFAPPRVTVGQRCWRARNGFGAQTPPPAQRRKTITPRLYRGGQRRAEAFIEDPWTVSLRKRLLGNASSEALRPDCAAASPVSATPAKRCSVGRGCAGGTPRQPLQRLRNGYRPARIRMRAPEQEPKPLPEARKFKNAKPPTRREHYYLLRLPENVSVRRYVTAPTASEQKRPPR